MAAPLASDDSTYLYPQQRQREAIEASRSLQFQTSMVYKVSSRAAMAVTGKACLKTTATLQKKKKWQIQN